MNHLQVFTSLGLPFQLYWVCQAKTLVRLSPSYQYPVASVRWKPPRAALSLFQRLLYRMNRPLFVVFVSPHWLWERRWSIRLTMFSLSHWSFRVLKRFSSPVEGVEGVGEALRGALARKRSIEAKKANWGTIVNTKSVTRVNGSSILVEVERMQRGNLGGPFYRRAIPRQKGALRSSSLFWQHTTSASVGKHRNAYTCSLELHSRGESLSWRELGNANSH